MSSYVGDRSMEGEGSLIVDLGTRGSSRLGEEISIGLRGVPRSLPSLLLWDSRGLRLFDELARDAVYYPGSKEKSLMRSHADCIAASIPAGSVIIELGSGNLSKTALLLKALAGQKKSFQYFALDVSRAELQASLARLFQRLPESAQDDIGGLCGTYEDLLWALDSSLHHLRSSNLTFLWFGNSLANAPSDKSFGLLRSLLSSGQSGAKAQAIVAIDGCRIPSQILKAYGAVNSAHHEFLMNGLVNANKVLGREAFLQGDWELATAFDASKGILTQDYVAKRYLEISMGPERFRIRPGEHVNICQSGKWDSEKVLSLARLSEIRVLVQWQHEDADYGMYLLCKDQD